jgi:hypothetical protein
MPEAAPGSEGRRVALVGLRAQATETDLDVLEVDVLLTSETAVTKPTAFDPWEKRREFFALKSTRELLNFLPTVGLFEYWGQFHQSDFAVMDSVAVLSEAGLPYRVEYPKLVRVSQIWKARKLLENSLKSGGSKYEIGDYTDFHVRLTRHRGQPRVVVTTTTFLGSLLLTLAIDRISDAKVRKCARPDCQVLFANSGGHDRKYCQRYCAHLESVRRDRERKKLLRDQLKGR